MGFSGAEGGEKMQKKVLVNLSQLIEKIYFC